MPLFDFNKYLSFRGIYIISMAGAMLFLLIMLRVEISLWYMVLIFGLILVYYDFDFVKRVKDSGSGYKVMGYFALLSLVLIGAGFIYLYLLAVGVLLAGPGFYLYRKKMAMSVEYGRRTNGI